MFNNENMVLNQLKIIQLPSNVENSKIVEICKGFWEYEGLEPNLN